MMLAGQGRNSYCQPERGFRPSWLAVIAVEKTSCGIVFSYEYDHSASASFPGFPAFDNRRYFARIQMNATVATVRRITRKTVVTHNVVVTRGIRISNERSFISHRRPHTRSMRDKPDTAGKGLLARRRKTGIDTHTRFRRRSLKTPRPCALLGEVKCRTRLAMREKPSARRIARRRALMLVTRILRFRTGLPVFFEMCIPRMPIFKPA